MSRIYLIGVAAFCAAVITTACSSGTSGQDKTATAAVRGAGTSPAATVSGGSPTATRATTPTAIPVVSDADATATEAVSRATATALAALDISGGDPNATPVIVVPIPTVIPRSGTTPVIDPTEIAPPNTSTDQISWIVDMDASTPGIQATRDVNRGDVFQVAIVLTNVPPNANNLGGLAALNFTLNYDKTKIFAPTYSGGPLTSRNPRLNLPDLGGVEAGWQCDPAAEGDLDDPGGGSGDGNPATGEAFLSCNTSGAAPSSGTLVVATISFTAVAEGSSDLTMTSVSAADSVAVAFASCGDDGPDHVVPCEAGKVTVR